MNSPEEQHNNYKNNHDTEEAVEEDLPRFGLSVDKSYETDFSPRLSVPVEDEIEKAEPFINMSINDKEVIEEKPTEEKQEQEVKEDNFAYPFGGWINEDNYKK